ncbi:MAG: c-type cytochrome, partial [Saprospiraceae bacterium]|nr:c-type cytochrome [Saprospiraceae bacterium]
AALATLGDLPAEVTKQGFTSLLGYYMDGSLDAALRLDLVEAIAAADHQELIAKLPTDPEAVDSYDDFQDCLEGGDAQRGRNIFIRNQAVQCMKCHMVGQWGGDAGPPLTSVGADFDRQYLLRSLVDPSAKIAPGFGVITLTLQNGDVVSGILAEETSEYISVKESDGSIRNVATDEIEDRIDAVSSMPSVKHILSKRQIRDLLEFLNTLDGHRPPA